MTSATVLIAVLILSIAMSAIVQPFVLTDDEKTQLKAIHRFPPPPPPEPSDKFIAWNPLSNNWVGQSAFYDARKKGKPHLFLNKILRPFNYDQWKAVHKASRSDQPPAPLAATEVKAVETDSHEMAFEENSFEVSLPHDEESAAHDAHGGVQPPVDDGKGEDEHDVNADGDNAAPVISLTGSDTDDSSSDSAADGRHSAASIVHVAARGEDGSEPMLVFGSNAFHDFAVEGLAAIRAKHNISDELFTDFSRLLRLSQGLDFQSRPRNADGGRAPRAPLSAKLLNAALLRRNESSPQTKAVEFDTYAICDEPSCGLLYKFDFNRPELPGSNGKPVCEMLCCGKSLCPPATVRSHTKRQALLPRSIFPFRSARRSLEYLLISKQFEEECFRCFENERHPDIMFSVQDGALWRDLTTANASEFMKRSSPYEHVDLKDVIKDFQQRHEVQHDAGPAAAAAAAPAAASSAAAASAAPSAGGSAAEPVIDKFTIAVGLHVDWAQADSKSTRTYGYFYYKVMNLDPSAAHAPENILLLGITPLPAGNSIEHILNLIVDELEENWNSKVPWNGKEERGWLMQSALYPDGRPVRLVLMGIFADLPASAKVCGHPFPNSRFNCFKCKFTRSIYTMQAKEKRSQGAFKHSIIKSSPEESAAFVKAKVEPCGICGNTNDVGVPKETLDEALKRIKLDPDAMSNSAKWSQTRLDWIQCNECPRGSNWYHKACVLIEAKGQVAPILNDLLNNVFECTKLDKHMQDYDDDEYICPLCNNRFIHQAPKHAVNAIKNIPAVKAKFSLKFLSTQWVRCLSCEAPRNWYHVTCALMKEKSALSAAEERRPDLQTIMKAFIHAVEKEAWECTTHRALGDKGDATPAADSKGIVKGASSSRQRPAGASELVRAGVDESDEEGSDHGDTCEVYDVNTMIEDLRHHRILPRTGLEQKAEADRVSEIAKLSKLRDTIRTTIATLNEERKRLAASDPKLQELSSKLSAETRADDDAKRRNKDLKLMHGVLLSRDIHPFAMGNYNLRKTSGRSPLFRLPYFNGPRMACIDDLHNRYLGVAKRLTHGLLNALAPRKVADKPEPASHPPDADRAVADTATSRSSSISACGSAGAEGFGGTDDATNKLSISAGSVLSTSYNFSLDEREQLLDRLYTLLNEFMIPQGVDNIATKVRANFSGMRAHDYLLWVNVYSIRTLNALSIGLQADGLAAAKKAEEDNMSAKQTSRCLAHARTRERQVGIIQEFLHFWEPFVFASQIFSQRAVLISHIIRADTFLVDFVERALRSKTFGQALADYKGVNFHLLRHVAAQLLDWGCASVTNNWANERFDGQMSDISTNHTHGNLQIMAKTLNNQFNARKQFATAGGPCSSTPKSLKSMPVLLNVKHESKVSIVSSTKDRAIRSALHRHPRTHVLVYRCPARTDEHQAFLDELTQNESPIYGSKRVITQRQKMFVAYMLIRASNAFEDAVGAVGKRDCSIPTAAYAQCDATFSSMIALIDAWKTFPNISKKSVLTREVLEKINDELSRMSRGCIRGRAQGKASKRSRADQVAADADDSGADPHMAIESTWKQEYFFTARIGDDVYGSAYTVNRSSSFVLDNRNRLGQVIAYVRLCSGGVLPCARKLAIIHYFSEQTASARTVQRAQNMYDQAEAVFSSVKRQRRSALSSSSSSSAGAAAAQQSGLCSHVSMRSPVDMFSLGVDGSHVECVPVSSIICRVALLTRPTSDLPNAVARVIPKIMVVASN